MVKRSIAIRLRDMLLSIEGAMEIVDGVDLERYRKSFRIRMAIERCVEVVSEASRHVPEEMRARHPDIPWPEVRAIGNVLRHDYARVDDRVIWRIATRSFPELKKVIEQLLAEVEGKKSRNRKGRTKPMTPSLRRVVVVGGVRTPFCRSNTLYADLSNLDMLTTALNGLVEKYHLAGVHIDEVVGGAVVTHSRDWNIAREAVIGTKLAPSTPGITMIQACGTSLQAAMGIAAKIATGEIDSGIACGSDTTSDAPIVVSKKLSQRLVQAQQAKSLGQRFCGLQGLRHGRAGTGAALGRGAAHRPLHGPALRADGAALEDCPRRPGPVGFRKSPQGCRGVQVRLHG